MTKAGLTDVYTENKEIGRGMETKTARNPPESNYIAMTDQRTSFLGSRWCDFGLLDEDRV
jgi:hypothetical protein